MAGSKQQSYNNSNRYKYSKEEGKMTGMTDSMGVHSHPHTLHVKSSASRDGLAVLGKMGGRKEGNEIEAACH
jgi:hypothetical protein